MQEINPIKRAKSLIKDMYEEIKSAELDNELEEKIDESLQNDQKVYILKEKMKVLKKELGEDSWKNEEVLEYRKALDKLKIEKEYSDYEKVCYDMLEVNVENAIYDALTISLFSSNKLSSILSPFFIFDDENA